MALAGIDRERVNEGVERMGEHWLLILVRFRILLQKIRNQVKLAHEHSCPSA